MSRGRRLFRWFVFGVALVAVALVLRHLPAKLSVVRFWPDVLAVGAGAALLALMATVRRHPMVRLFLFGAGLLAGGVWFATPGVPAATPGRGYWLVAVSVGAVAVLVAVLRADPLRSGSAGVIGRWSRRSRRNDGVASAWQVLRTSSAWSARRKAKILRPSLRRVSWWRRWCTPIRELATPLARVGLLRVWSPVEDVTLRVGGPRTGKTGELAGRILDAPGAVIATSTRTDLVELTGPCRAKRGPLHVFNPSGLGGLESTITFDPLAGCGAPTIATSRAADLLAAVSAPGSGGDREFWAGQARRVLAALMHAAALSDASMRDVLAWVADPDQAAADVCPGVAAFAGAGVRVRRRAVLGHE